MTSLKTLLTEVAALVGERKTIDHGSLRCLYSQQSASEIEAAEGCDEVETCTIGDDDLADKLNGLVDNPRRLLDIDARDLAEAIQTLEGAHLGAEISAYLDAEAENELKGLDDLITAAKQFRAAL